MTQTQVALLDQPVIDAAQLRQAREQAVIHGTSLIKVLEETWQGTPDELIVALSRALRVPMPYMSDLHPLYPAFDKLPFAQAVKHESALLQKPD
ncbi:hypothetical protein SQ11_15485, partial [Nitrosospira sp. NpAV]